MTVLYAECLSIINETESEKIYVCVGRMGAKTSIMKRKLNSQTFRKKEKRKVDTEFATADTETTNIQHTGDCVVWMNGGG